MPVTVDATAVTAWLKKNNADAFKQEFFDAGCYDLDDITDAEIDAIVAPTAARAAARLKRVLAKKDVKPTPPPMPDLPPGIKVDLASPDVTLPDGSQFTIPQSVPGLTPGSGDGGAADATINDPRSLTPDQWMIIARHMNLLYGFDMSGDAPQEACKPALQWVVPRTDAFVKAKDYLADVSTSYVFDSSSARYVTSGFNTETATASYLFASASFSREQTYSNAHDQQEQSVWITGSWWFPRATLMLDQCTEVHPQFVEDMVTALASVDPLVAVHKIFAEYGHAIQRTVTLGGELFFQERKQAQAVGDASTYSQTIKAAVNIKFGSASGSAGGSEGSSSDTRTEEQQLADKIDWTVRGGDPMQYQDRSAWERSVKQWNLWAVIRDESITQKATPTFDLLPANVQDALRRLLRGPLGAPSPWPLNTDVRLTSDGFVLGMLDATPGPGSPPPSPALSGDGSGPLAVVPSPLNDGARGRLTAYTDGNDNGDPTTLSGTASAFKYSGSSKECKYASLLTPVRRGDHAKVMYEPWPGTSLDPRQQTLFFSLGPADDGAYLAQAEYPNLAPNAETFETQTDGFLTCTLRTAPGDGPVLADLRLFATPNPDNGPVVSWPFIAGASVYNHVGSDNWYTQNSLCIPTPASTFVVADIGYNGKISYIKDLEDLVTDLGFAATWTPLAGGLGFDKPHQGPRQVGTRYTAETDGFLLATLAAPRGGEAHLTVDVMPGSLDGAPVPPQTLGRASVHRRPDSEPQQCNNLTYSTVTVPVRAASTYLVSVNQVVADINGRDVERHLTWIPLITT